MVVIRVLPVMMRVEAQTVLDQKGIGLACQSNAVIQ